MTDREYLIAVARVCDDLLKNAAKSFGLDFSVLSDTLLETERRAKALGLTRAMLFPKVRE